MSDPKPVRFDEHHTGHGSSNSFVEMPMAIPIIRRLYFAHAMCTYGCPLEKRELRVIRGHFARITLINPSRYDGHPEKLADTLGFCLRLIEGCDAVVFSRLMGKVTAGVGREVNHALKKGKAVYELTDDRIVRRHRPIAYLRRVATIRLYQRWRFETGWQ